MAPFWEQGGLWRSQGERGWWHRGHLWHWGLSPLLGVAASRLSIGTFSPGGAHQGLSPSRGTDPSVSPDHPSAAFPYSLPSRIMLQVTPVALVAPGCHLGRVDLKVGSPRDAPPPGVEVASAAGSAWGRRLCVSILSIPSFPRGIGGLHCCGERNEGRFRPVSRRHLWATSRG